MDAQLLVVPSSRQPEMNHCAVPAEKLWRDKVSARELRAVSSDEIDLFLSVRPLQHPVRPTATRTTADDNNVSSPNRGLALNTHEPGVEIENQIVALVPERLGDADTKSNGRISDRQFSKSPSLLAPKHLPILVA
jgi:hypothetical protein